MKLLALTPGTMGLCSLACELFGPEAIVPTGWGSPVYVDMALVDPSDLAAGVELIQERGQERNMLITVKEVER